MLGTLLVTCFKPGWRLHLCVLRRLKQCRILSNLDCTCLGTNHLQSVTSLSHSISAVHCPYIKRHAVSPPAIYDRIKVCIKCACTLCRRRGAEPRQYKPPALRRLRGAQQGSSTSAMRPRRRESGVASMRRVEIRRESLRIGSSI